MGNRVQLNDSGITGACCCQTRTVMVAFAPRTPFVGAFAAEAQGVRLLLNHMSLEHILNTSRAILFEHRDEPLFTYFGGGSGFLFTWQGRTYVVTAKHVSRQGRDDQIRVSVDDDTPAFLRFDLAFSPEGDDQDWKDLTFFRVDSRPDPAAMQRLAFPLGIAGLRAATEYYSSGQPLWISGYPGAERSIDYDSGHINLVRCYLRGFYDEPDDAAIGKHRIKIDAQLDSFGGLSGSPVFVELSPDSILWAGLLIQGSASSGLAHFLDTPTFATLLTQLPQAAA